MLIKVEKPLISSKNKFVTKQLSKQRITYKKKNHL